MGRLMRPDSQTGNLLNAAVSGAVLAARGLFAALFPADCRLCGAPLENISRLPVCPACLAAIHPISYDTCGICGEGLGAVVASSEVRLCVVCQEQRPSFTKAAAYGAYDGELRELIHLFKYEQVVPAARVLAEMLGQAIAKLSFDRAPMVVIPVPLHASKQRQRTFNQAETLARAVMKRCPDINAQLATDVLIRARATVSQIGLTRPQRVENMRGAFRVVRPDRLKERSILLIDDVLTTGTTASECARILRKAGVESVFVATVARTLKRAEAGFEFTADLEIAAG